MTNFSFKYRLRKRGDGVERKFPYIPIEIKGSASWISTAALLDSGADISVLPWDMAELLNLDLSGKETIANGLGGQVRVKNSRMTIRIKNAHDKIELNIPIQIILEPSKAPPIIGRDGFFDKFIIEFDHFGERIHLKTVNMAERKGKFYK